MSDTWYYVRDKKKLGPIAWDQLQQLARTGQLAPADMVLKNGSTKWQAARDVSGLVPATPVTATPVPATPVPTKPQPAADQWFYVQAKKKYGPVTFQQLKELAGSGKLLVNDMVLKAGQSKWQNAGDVSGLFPLSPVKQVIEEDEEDDEEELHQGERHEDDEDETDADEEEIDVEPYLDRARQCHDRGDYGRALAEYHELVRLLPTEPEGYNGLAWILATCPDAKFRNGTRAVQYARKAVDLHAKSDDPDEPDSILSTLGAVEYQRTLAAAHAEAGDFAAALTALEVGFASAPAAERPRLACYKMLYRMRRPYRDLPGPVVAQS